MYRRAPTKTKGRYPNAILINPGIGAHSLCLGKRKLWTRALSPAAYNLRFLWRLAREALRRLCLLILALRRFFNDPIFVSVSSLVKA